MQISEQLERYAIAGILDRRGRQPMEEWDRHRFLHGYQSYVVYVLGYNGNVIDEEDHLGKMAAEVSSTPGEECYPEFWEGVKSWWRKEPLKSHLAIPENDDWYIYKSGYYQAHKFPQINNELSAQQLEIFQ